MNMKYIPHRPTFFIWIFILFVTLYILLNWLLNNTMLSSNGNKIQVKSVYSNSFAHEIKNRITEFAKTIMACKGVPGMTISMVKDHNVWLLPLGYRDVNNKSPVTEETKFLIGSITKTFTAQLAAIMIQESQGKISWDTQLKEILGPTFTMSMNAHETVTLRDILSHRSGLVSGNLAVRASLPQNISRRAFLQLLHHVPVTGRSNTNFLYSNMGYTLVGAILEHWTNQSWEHLIKRNIFDPLGMSLSSVVRNAEDLISEQSAKPYVPVEGGIKNCDPSIYVLGPMAVAGDIMSNAKDMAKWIQFVLRKGNNHDDVTNVTEAHLLEDMWTPCSQLDKQFQKRTEKRKSKGWPKDDVNLGYGLGWFVNKYNGKMNYWHGGGLYSYYSLVWILPESNLGFFISINGYKGCSEPVHNEPLNCPCGSSGFNVIEPMAYFLTDILNNEQTWLDMTNGCAYPQAWTNCSGQQHDVSKKQNQLNHFNISQTTEEIHLNKNNLKRFSGTFSNPLLGDSFITVDTRSSELYFQLRLLTGILHRQSGESGLSFWLESDGRYKFLSKPDDLSHVPVKKTFTFKFNMSNQTIDSVHIYFSADEPPFLFKKINSDDSLK